VTTFDERIERAANFVRTAKRIVAFTGAGISTESGISDFRSPGGVWDRYRIVTYQEFLASREAREGYWKMKKELYVEIAGAQPNRAHHSLAELERMGKLTCLITQNIDGLHQEAGSRAVIEIHGTNRKAICVRCGKQWPIAEIQSILESGNYDPRCDQCSGFIKPATISFGQAMPEREMTLAYECAMGCDLFFMIGSSLQVEPAASLPRVAKRSGADLVFVNRTETPYDHMASVLFRESAGHVLDEIVRALQRDPLPTRRDQQIGL